MKRAVCWFNCWPGGGCKGRCVGLTAGRAEGVKGSVFV